MGSFLRTGSPLQRLIPRNIEARDQLSQRGFGRLHSRCIKRTIFKYLGTEEALNPLQSDRYTA